MRNWLLLLVIGVVLLVPLIGIIYLLAANQNNEAVILPTAFIPPTEVAHATATLTLTPTLTNSPTPIPSNTFPPTWTPTFTFTVSPTFTPSHTPTVTATLTPSFTPTVPPPATDFSVEATIDPLTLENSYWTGDGVKSMEDYQYEGAYLRFYKFPVMVWINRPDDALWSPALNYTINLLSPIVPMERTEFLDEADITVYVDDAAEYYSHCPAQTSGCASMEYDYDAAGDFVPFSWVHLLADYPQPYISIVHEVIHALGVFVHSPDINDVMWFSEGYGDGLSLSERDRNTLAILYALPAYGEDE